MRILHVGGFALITYALAASQRGFGHEVEVVGASVFDAPLKVPLFFPQLRQEADAIGRTFDLVQFHLGASVMAPAGGPAVGLPEVLQHLKQSGRKVTYFSYWPDPLAMSLAYAAEWREILGLFDHLFIGSVDCLGCSQHAKSWSWLAPPLDLSTLPAPNLKEPRPHELSVIYGASLIVADEIACIKQALGELSSSNFKFIERQIHFGEAGEAVSLCRLFQEHDLFIEQLGRASYGFLGLLAMAGGRTIVSGNTPEAKRAWDQLSLSPVIDGARENLLRRLSNIVREPRCLRDFGKRSRQFVEAHHQPVPIARLTLDCYARL